MEWYKKYFEFFGLEEKASHKEFKRAYRNFARMYHPDKGGSLEICQMLTSFHKILHVGFYLDEVESLDLGIENLDLPPPYLDIMFLGDHPRLSKAFADKLLTEQQKFKRISFTNNFSQAFIGIVEEGIQQFSNQMESNPLTSQDNFFYCKTCNKHFTLKEEHFLRIMKPYVQIFTGDPPNQMDSKPNDVFFHLEKIFGSKVWDFKIILPTSMEMDFWTSPRWLEVIPKVDQLVKFIKEIPKGLEVIKKLGPELQEISEISRLKPYLNVPKHPIPSGLDKITFRLKNGRGEKGIPVYRGKVIQIDMEFLDKVLLTKEKGILKNTLIPYYIIQDPPKRDRSTHECSVCGHRNIFIQFKSKHCKVCGKSVCRKCYTRKRVLYLGYNQDVKVCYACNETCHDMDAKIWAKGALNALEERRMDLSQIYLTICSFLCAKLGSLSPDLRSILNEVTAVAFETGEVQSLIISKTCLKLKPNSWSYIAYECVKNGYYSGALECLKLIPESNSREDDSLWENLGDLLVKHDPQLSLFCFDKIRNNSNSKSKWLLRASRFQKEIHSKDKFTAQSAKIMTYHCIKRGLAKLSTTKEVLQQILSLFTDNQNRLAFYSLEAEAKRIGLEEIVEMIIAIGKLGNIKDEINQRILPVLILILYVNQSFPKSEIQELKAKNTLLNSILEAVYCGSDGSSMDRFIQNLENSFNISSIIPIISQVKGHSGFRNWAKLVELAVQTRKFHAAMVFMKLQEVEALSRENKNQKSFFPKLWTDLSLQIIHAHPVNSSSSIASKAIQCILLGGQDSINSNIMVTLTDKLDEHEAAAALCLHFKKPELLYETGMDLDFIDIHPAASNLFLGLYLRELRGRKDLEDEEKVKRILQICDADSFPLCKDCSHVMLKIKQSILTTFQDCFINEVAYPIHLMTVDEIAKRPVEGIGLKELNQILATLHIIPSSELTEFYNDLLPQVFNRLLNEAYVEEDFVKFTQVLLILNPVCISQSVTFIKEKLCKYDPLEFSLTRISYPFNQNMKIMLVLLKGTIEKTKGNLILAQEYFERGLDICPTLEILKTVCELVAQLFIQQPDFHEKVITEIRNEMVEFNFRLESGSGMNDALFEGLSILFPKVLPEGAFDEFKVLIDEIKPEGLPFYSEIHEFEDFLQSISIHGSAYQKGLIWIDFSQNLKTANPIETSTGEAIALLMAGAHFLVSMDDTVSASRIYGIKSLIEDVITRLQRIIPRTNPWFQTYVCRMMFSLSARAFHNFAQIINIHNQWNREMGTDSKKCNVVPYSDKERIGNILGSFVTLGKVNPFIYTPASSMIDCLYMDKNRIEFFKAFFNGKSSPGGNFGGGGEPWHSKNLPEFLFSFYRFDGVKNGWFIGISRADAEEAANQAYFRYVGYLGDDDNGGPPSAASAMRIRVYIEMTKKWAKKELKQGNAIESEWLMMEEQVKKVSESLCRIEEIKITLPPDRTHPLALFLSGLSTFITTEVKQKEQRLREKALKQEREAKILNKIFEETRRMLERPQKIRVELFC